MRVRGVLPSVMSWWQWSRGAQRLHVQNMEELPLLYHLSAPTLLRTVLPNADIPPFGTTIIVPSAAVNKVQILLIA